MASEFWNGIRRQLTLGKHLAREVLREALETQAVNWAPHPKPVAPADGMDATKAASGVGSTRDAAALRRVIEELAPKVREASGLNLDPAKVEVRVVSRDEAFAMMLADVEARNGEPVDLSKTSPSAVAAMKAQIGGGYLPSANAMVLPSDTTTAMSDDDVRELLFHELIHAAQHQTYPGVFRAAEAASRATRRAQKEFGPHSFQARDAADTESARYAFLEGHATQLQVREAKSWPTAKGYLPAMRQLLGLLAHPDSAGKLMQYVLGRHVFERLDTPEGRSIIQQAYQSPQLVDVLLKTRGTVNIELLPGADVALAEKLVAAVREAGDVGTRVTFNVRPAGQAQGASLSSGPGVVV